VPKKLEHEVAAAAMRERGADPLEEYPGNNKKWHCRCMKCQADIWPNYANVVTNGYGPCKPCGIMKRTQARIIPNSRAAAAMRQRGAEPLEKYPGSKKAWHCKCMECGADIWPCYADVVTAGNGPCKPCGYRKGSQKRSIPHDEAFSLMLAANFQPSVPYPGSTQPWPGVCLKCGQPGSPSYGHVRDRGSACGYCAGRKVDEAIARGKMLGADFQPDPGISFPGSDVPWNGFCLKCGCPGSPSYTNVRQGSGACGNCAEYGYKTSKTGYVYFCAGADWLKGGITNVPKARLSTHKSQGLIEVLHLWEYADGSIPVDLERLWKEHLATLPDTDRPEKHDLKDGWTESIRRTVELEQWIEQTFKPLADDLLAAPLAA